MTDLRRRNSSSSCSPPTLHSWTCAPAGSAGLHACSSSRKEEGGQLEGREEREQLGTGREERRRGSCRTVAIEAAAAAGRER